MLAGKAKGSVALAAALGLLVMGALPVAASEVSSQGFSAAFHTDFDAIVGAPGHPTVVAHGVLGPGKWLVTAHGTFVNQSNSPRSVKCSLQTPGATDITWTSIAGGNRLVPLLSHRIASITGNGFSIKWECQLVAGSRGDVTASWTHLSAIKIGSLYTVDLLTGSQTVTGSAAPTAWSGYLAGPIDVPGINDPQTIASLPLAAGTYVVLAKATVKSNGNVKVEVDCRLTQIHDEMSVYLGSTGVSMGRGTLEGSGVATVTSSQPVSLVCPSNRSAGDAKLTHLRITAIGVDDAYVKLLPAGTQHADTTQVFWRDAQRSACCTNYAGFDLPNGDWLLYVTARTYDPHNDGGGYINCFMYYEYASTLAELDESWLSVAPFGDAGSENTLSMSGGSRIARPSHHAHIIVSCNAKYGGTYAGADTSSIRIIALRISSIDFG
jgi:hypothetical protein